MPPTVFVDSTVLAEMKLENYRRNRQNCPPAHRGGFYQLIAMAEAELDRKLNGDCVSVASPGSRGDGPTASAAYR